MTDDRGIKEVFFEPGRLCVVCVHPFTFPQQRLKCNQYLIKYVRHMHSAPPAIALLDVRALFYHSPVVRLLQYPALQVSQGQEDVSDTLSQQHKFHHTNTAWGMAVCLLSLDFCQRT